MEFKSQIGSWRACTPARPTGKRTWRRWRLRPITDALTGSCSPRPRGFEEQTPTSLDLLYDVSHNLAKIEDHPVDDRTRTVCVHRKGATRSLPPHHPDVQADLAAVGQPVLIPGTMGTASYELVGVAGNPAFLSTAHGAGRVQSRHQAARHTNADVLRRDLEEHGILVRGRSRRGLAEEKPEAYKDIDAVIEPATAPASRAKWHACSPRGGERLSTHRIPDQRNRHVLGSRSRPPSADW